MSKIQQIEVAILAFLKKLKNSFPKEVTHLAILALGITQEAEKLLDSGTAITITTLDPALEPYREGIMDILKELEIAFKAVSGTYQKGALLTAQAKITGLAHGNILASNRYYLAASAVYSDLPQSETKEVA